MAGDGSTYTGRREAKRGRVNWTLLGARLSHAVTCQPILGWEDKKAKKRSVAPPRPGCESLALMMERVIPLHDGQLVVRSPNRDILPGALSKVGNKESSC